MVIQIGHRETYSYCPLTDGIVVTPLKTQLKTINLFYRAYYHKNYKKDEEALHAIIKNHVSPRDES